MGSLLSEAVACLGILKVVEDNEGGLGQCAGTCGFGEAFGFPGGGGGFLRDFFACLDFLIGLGGSW